MTEIENDLQQLDDTITLFDTITKIDYQTVLGKEFQIKISESLEEIIKPIARDYYKNIKSCQK